LEMINKTGTID